MREASLGEHALGLKEEQQKIYRGAAWAFFFCSTIFVSFHLFLPQLVELPDRDLEARLAFWAGADLFVVLWVMVGVKMVSTGRRLSVDDIRGSAYSEPSPRLAVPVAFLQNTLEQAFIAIFTQLALLLLLGDTALPLIAASVLLFGIGRATFLAGYPHGAGARSFGMAVTALPSVLAIVLSIWAVLSSLWY